MLVLEREERQRIFVGGDITIIVVRIDKHAVRLGIEAPDGVEIWREEVYKKKIAKLLDGKSREDAGLK
jgi:carbon storage regulator